MAKRVVPDQLHNSSAQAGENEAAPEDRITNRIHDVPIEDLELSVRAYNCLKRAGITKVGEVLDLLEVGEEKILAVRNFGRKPLGELVENLDAKGILAIISSENVSVEVATDDEFIGVGVFSGKTRLVSLSKDGQYRVIDGTSKLHSILYVVTTEAIAVKAAIEELECLMNDSNATESAFQGFFERNPRLILNDEYKRAHPHITLTRDEGRLIPDFLLEPLDQNGLCDILDLKLPTAKILVLKQSRMRYSAAVMEACAQLREYNNYFDERDNRDRVFRQYGLKAYKPKMIVIIGRRGSVDLDPISFQKIQSDTPQLVLRTYDDILNRAKARLQGPN